MLAVACITGIDVFFFDLLLFVHAYEQLNTSENMCMMTEFVGLVCLN